MFYLELYFHFIYSVESYNILIDVPLNGWVRSKFIPFFLHHLFPTGDVRVAGTHQRLCKFQDWPIPTVKVHQARSPNGVHLAPTTVSLIGLTSAGRQTANSL